MDKRKLNQNEMETIAHFITQRRITGMSDVSPGETNKAIQVYLETYADIMDKLQQHNSSIM